MKNNVFKKNIISSLVFVIFLFIVFYFIFQEISFSYFFSILLKTEKIYILIAILCASLFSVFEAINIKQILVLLDTKISFLKCYKYALVGYFFSSITPSSSGGDPMQLYYMSKDKIPISRATIALLIKLVNFQFSSILIALIGFIVYYDFLSTTLGNFKYLIYLGFLLNVFTFLFLTISIFSKKMAFYIVNLLYKILNKIHYSNINILKEKIDIQINDYVNSSTYFKKNKKILFKLFFVSFIQLFLNFSIPYFVYLSLGFHQYSVIMFVLIQAVLSISVSSLPFPGAVLISESVFVKLYKTLFPKHLLKSAMLISRVIGFYLFVFISGISLLFISLFNKFYKKREC